MLYIVYATKIHVPWPKHPQKDDIVHVHYLPNTQGIILIHYFRYTGATWLFYGFTTIEPKNN